MRIVIALGGNALLRQGEPMTTEVQRRNIRTAAEAIVLLAAEHSIVVVHGNGPQVGLLSLQAESYHDAEPYPLDVLDAGTQGIIGYLIQQELRSLLPPDRQVATLLTMITVAPDDPAFASPAKFVGPVYAKESADALAAGERLGVQAGRHRLAAGGAVTPAPPDPGDRADLLADRAGSRGHLRRRRRHPYHVLLLRAQRTDGRRGGHRQGPGQRAAGRGCGRGPVRDGHRRGRGSTSAGPRPSSGGWTGPRRRNWPAYGLRPGPWAPRSRPRLASRPRPAREPRSARWPTSPASWPGRPATPASSRSGHPQSH